MYLFFLSYLCKKLFIMRKVSALLTTVLLIISTLCYSQVKTGIEVLRERNFDVLQGKRVGLCTNPTGVDRNLVSTIDILHNAPNVNLVALYGPEHGVRGNIYAGDHVDNEIDVRTGLKMYSLYGKTSRPTQDMMDEIDVMVYDIQDIGCRSYTYISTMGNLMEACQKYGKELVILDRPNPLGGNKIEGCLVEDGFFSFVSRFAIPYIYGQTPGELALYLNAKAEKPCKLTVVEMEGWTRDMKWEDTGLEWVVASPHVPHGRTAIYYPVTGIFGEFYYINIGVGYTMPFEVMGAPWVNADSLASALNALELPGVVFRGLHYKPYYSVFKGENIQGVQIHITDYEKVALSEIQFYVVQEMMRLWGNQHDWFAECDQKRFSMFNKVCGTDQIKDLFGKRYRWEDAKAYWDKDVEKYREESSKYYLY